MFAACLFSETGILSRCVRHFLRPKVARFICPFSSKELQPAILIPYRVMSNVVRKAINSDNAPPAAVYSHAVQTGKLLFLSGQIGIDKNRKMVAGGVAEQTEQALKNLSAVLETSGAKKVNVVKVTVLLKDMADYQAMNEIYMKHFPTEPPARAAYQVVALPFDGLVEIEAVAALE